MKSDLSTRNINIILDGKYEISPNLHIKVTVIKSNLSLPNSAKVEIYNVSDKSFKKMLTTPKVVISVDDTQIFVGKIINATNEYQGTSWKCTMYCNDIHTNPFKKPQFLAIPKGTSNEDVLSKLTSLISTNGLNVDAFKECAKSKGSLLKQFMLEYKKEGDIVKAMQDMLKGCEKEIIKEDGKVKISNTTGVPNQAKPLLFDRLLESPKLSHKDLIVKVPMNTKLKLGLGFKIKAKSISKTLISPYTYQNQFKDRIYRISEFTHEVDNYTNAVAQTTVKGLNFG